MHDALCERHALSCNDGDASDNNDPQRVVDAAGRRRRVVGGGSKHAGQRCLQFDDFVHVRCVR